MTQRLACKLITEIILWHQRWRQCFGAVFSMCPSCPCVLGLIVYCWQGWCKKEGPVFSFSLSVCHVDVFPRNPSFLCVLFCSFLPPFVFLSLSLSLSIRLTVSHPSSLRLDQQQRRRVKFSVFSLLIFSLCTLSAWSSDHTSLSFSSITVDFSTGVFFPFVHCSPWNSSDSNTTEPQDSPPQVLSPVTQTPFEKYH